MTEEQFWHSNPVIIQVWEKAYREEQRRKNELIHAWIGNYGISALMYAIDHCLNGRKASTKYVEKPIQLFELNEEEKEQAAIKARQAFVAWASRAEKKYKGKGESNGRANN